MVHYKPRLSDAYLPPPIWNIFFRQIEAFEYAETRKDAKVFSVEYGDNNGPRKYIVASLEEFWMYYKQFPSGTRHYYEVIPQDAHCHLYFDLEFDKSVNKNINGADLIEVWIAVVIFCLKKTFNISASRKNIVELDSTTDAKFSQHQIWHLSNAAFRNNFEAGKFVRNMCSIVRSTLSDDSMSQKHRFHPTLDDKLNLLMVNKSTGEKVLFVDECVYTKNRNFRLYLSSKKGKVKELKLSSKCQFNFEPVNLLDFVPQIQVENIKKLQGIDQEKLIFFSSLVSNVPLNKDLNVLEFSSEESDSIRTSETNVAAILASKIYYKSKPSEIELPDNISQSFYGQLYNFVSEYLQQFNQAAAISKVSIAQDNKCIFFDVTGSRYCRSIGREHKSNGIFVVVNLEKRLLYHRCYDHECRMSVKKPEPVPIPISISEQVKNDKDVFSTDVSDGELLEQVEKFEKAFKK